MHTANSPTSHSQNCTVNLKNRMVNCFSPFFSSKGAGRAVMDNSLFPVGSHTGTRSAGSCLPLFCCWQRADERARCSHRHAVNNITSLPDLGWQQNNRSVNRQRNNNNNINNNKKTPWEDRGARRCLQHNEGKTRGSVWPRDDEELLSQSHRRLLTNTSPPRRGAVPRCRQRSWWDNFGSCETLV